MRFIVRNQASDGGFALVPGGPSNAQSTAWAIQGLVAAGRDPAKVRRNSSRDPMSYLRSLTADDGSVRYSRGSRQTPVWVTGQAVAALSRKPLPLAPVKRARRSATAATAAPAATPAATATPDDRQAEATTPQPLPPVATAAPTLPAAVVAAAGVPAAGLVAAALVGSRAHV